MNLLVNAYFAKNLGDDLFLKILFDRYPDVNWHLLTSNQEYGGIFQEYDNVSVLKGLSINILGLKSVDVFSKVNNLFFKYRKYDGLIIIGGSIFMESPDWKDQLEARSLLPGKLKKLNKKSFIIGANFGPYTNDSFIESHKEFLNLFKDVCFRDQYSYNLFDGQNNVRLASDIVFNIGKSDLVTKERSIGFSLINLQSRSKLSSYNQEYNKKMIELIEYYIELDYKIKLFSFCEKEGDLIVCRYIKEQIHNGNNEKIEIINYNGNIDNFLLKFQKCKAIVGTRFHSIILALIYGQDVLPIVYSDKTFNVLQDMELDNYSYLIKDIERIKPDHTELYPSLFLENIIIEKAKTQFKELDLFIKNPDQIF